MKCFLKTIVFLVIMSTLLRNCMIAEAATNAPTKVINVVYDDSGSMIEMSGVKYDTWCQAKYSMEVFAAMLSEKDTMNVYVMSDYDDGDISAPPRLTLKGSDGVAANVDKVHNMITHAGNTPFDSVRKAYSDLKAVSADEKWLIVLTDGEFQNVDDMDAYFQQKTSDIKVMFLGMGAAAGQIRADEANNIFFEKAETNSEILNKITDICTRVFNSDKLEVDVNSKKFSFDVPMSELVVFAQGAGVQINGLKDASGNEIDSSGAPVSVRYSDVATTNTRYKDFKVASDLVGCISTFKGDFDSGKYQVDVTGAETIEIYYKPNVEIAVYLTTEDGVEVTEQDALEAGDYYMTFGFVKAGTDEKVEESKLLGDVKYSARVAVNDVWDDKQYSSGDKVTVEEGKFQVDVTVNYLKYNTASVQKTFEIYRNKALELTVAKNPEYTLDKTGFTNSQEPIVVKATLEGNELTEEQWAALGLPVIEMVKHADKRVGFTVEKSETIGEYNIYPKLLEGKTTIGDYDDIDIGITLSAKYNKEAWKGETTDMVEITDTRSWFEKNIDKVIKLAILLGILLLILGYIPPFKKYLPKKLKKNPTVECKPNIPGKKRWTAHGRFSKKTITTFIPYKAEEGTIRFLPGGVAGVSALQVKAIGGQKMEITNTRSYAGKKNFSIDGVTILEGTKKNLEKSAGMIIKFDTKEADYVCSPNK